MALVLFEIILAESHHFEAERVVAHIPALPLVEHFESRIELAAGLQPAGGIALQNVGVTIIKLRRGSNIRRANHGRCSARNSSAALQIFRMLS